MSVEEVSGLLSQLEASENVTEILEKLAELFERETEAFLKKDPDPFDDRHPSRLQPDCTLGHMLKTIFRNERVVDSIVKVYIEEENLPLNTAACRLLLDILPGLENVIFEEEGFVPRLLHFVETAPNPLRSYATGLVAAAMDCTDIAANFRERNAYFVPLMLKRLHEVSRKYLKSPPPETNDMPFNPNRPFAALKKIAEKRSIDDIKSNSYKSPKRKRKSNDTQKNLRYNPNLAEVKSGTSWGPELQEEIFTTEKTNTTLKSPPADESSNSKWSEMMIGSYSMFPLTLAMEQRFILQYLTPMGQYEELIRHIFESNVLFLILRYIDIRQNPDVRLAFEALKYLASLLVHKKIAIEFLSIGGLKLLLKVPYPSISATGVSICLYYFSYTEEVMEKICMGSSPDISELVTYALYLLTNSHDSSRCHSTMFFGFSFAFKIILQHFDEQDGLRKLFNVMSTLEIFAMHDFRALTDDQAFANRQTTRHVCAALKRYFEAHLASEIENVSNSDFQSTRQSKHKAMNLSPKSIEGCIEHWLEFIGPMRTWRPVEEFIKLDGVSFLLELISDYFSTSSYSGRADTVKTALDVLKICSLSSSTQLAFCEKINSTDYVATTGITVLLSAAEGELFPAADIQKAALETIINCVCTKLEGEIETTRSKSQRRVRAVHDLLSEVCENVRVKNGIMTLINLLSTKTPLTDADAIRALACKALCGLARSSQVKQIISKLRIITDGELLHLMKEPVLSDKSEDHLKFVKYGLELIEKVTGTPVSVGSESSMLNINKSEIIAKKTKIAYHEAQLMQLICMHLNSRGFSETAKVLDKEMKDKNILPQPLTPSLAIRNSPKSMVRRSMLPSSSHSPISHSPCSNAVTPIPPPFVPLKIVMKKVPEYKSPISSRLQKSIRPCSGNFLQTPALKHQNINFSHDFEPGISLHSIITEYLRKHHAQCPNPMLACPPFDLFSPHRCPEPQNRRNAPNNCVQRIYKKETYHKYGGIGGASLDLKSIYNKFRFVRAYRDAENECDFACCSFFNYDVERTPRLLIGTDGQALGELKVFNLHTGEEEMSKNGHFRGLSHMESTRYAPLIITSDGGRIGNSSLWKLGDELEVMHQFNEIYHLEFGKRNHLKLVGTKHDSAVIVDTNTGSETVKFLTRDIGNSYPTNRATFDYSDELVLTDGIIFDSRSSEKNPLHKFDKFNSIMNGVFHPNGREIISNTEIWDVRTYKLLRTVSGLEYCRPTFNPTGTIIYGVFCYKDAPDERTNCFYSFDASDYSSIATVDVKRTVFELSADINDRYVATIESQSAISTDPYNPPIRGLDCVCRLYEIGRSKEDGDEDNEESEDTEEESEDDEENDEMEGPDEASGHDVEDILFELDNDQEEIDSNEASGYSSSSSSSDALFSLNLSVDE